MKFEKKNLNRHDLHLIVDEIFGLTVHDEDAEFRSILSIPEALDSERVHMVWGISKVRERVYPTKYSFCSCVLLCLGYIIVLYGFTWFIYTNASLPLFTKR